MDIRTEVRDWLSKVDWDTELTLTFSNAVSEHQAEAAIRKFWNKVDWTLYGNAVIRFNKRCLRANMLQGDGKVVHYHFHCLSKRPSDRFSTVTAYCDFLREQWLETNHNNFAITIEPIRNKKGYTHYVSRQVGRDNCDAFSIHSSHIAAH